MPCTMYHMQFTCWRWWECEENFPRIHLMLSIWLIMSILILHFQSTVVAVESFLRERFKSRARRYFYNFFFCTVVPTHGIFFPQIIISDTTVISRCADIVAELQMKHAAVNRFFLSFASHPIRSCVHTIVALIEIQKVLRPWKKWDLK
jgi:hypothetical protein